MQHKKSQYSRFILFLFCNFVLGRGGGSKNTIANLVPKLIYLFFDVMIIHVSSNFYCVRTVQYINTTSTTSRETVLGANEQLIFVKTYMPVFSILTSSFY